LAASSNGRGLFFGFLLLGDDNTSISAGLGFDAAGLTLSPETPILVAALVLHLRATHRAYRSSVSDWLRSTSQLDGVVLCIQSHSSADANTRF
jgi:hypothetical protein